jgi:hypothetical protein
VNGQIKKPEQQISVAIIMWLPFHWYVKQNYICRWRKMVLAIRLRMQLDYCFPIMSSDGLVYYLTFKWSLRPSTLFHRTNNTHAITHVSGKLNILCMQLKLLYNNAAHPNICEAGIVRIYIFAWPHHLTSKERCGPIKLV